MKKSIIIIIVVVIVLILGVTAFFLGMNTRDDLEKVVSKKDPVTNKDAVTLIVESDTEGLERAQVTKSENELILDFLTEALGLYDWKKIENARQRLLDEGVTDKELQLFFNKIYKLLINQDFVGLEKMGFTEEKIQTLMANWNQEKAEKMVNDYLIESRQAAMGDKFWLKCNLNCSFTLENSMGKDEGDIYIVGYDIPKGEYTADNYIVAEKFIEFSEPYEQDITGKLNAEKCTEILFIFGEGLKAVGQRISAVCV